MKPKAFIKACLLSLIFFSEPAFSAQVVDVEMKEPADSTRQVAPVERTSQVDLGGQDVPVLQKLQQKADSITAEMQLRACVAAFTVQTVSSYLSVVGCDTLYVQGVTVANGGDLYLSAPGNINIHGAFEVNVGGALDVNFSPPPPTFSFTYTYDASGKRTGRTFVP